MNDVPIEKLNDVIVELQRAALNYASAVLQDVRGGSGPGGVLIANGATLDLETMAIQYVRKLDEEHRKANEVKVAEDAASEAKKSHN